MKAPLIDHTGKPSWTSTIVIAWLVVIVVALGLLFFAPESIADRVLEARSFLRDSFFAVVVAYVVRRHTQAKHETNGAPETPEPAENE